jgi:hypothetical protein
MPSLSTDALESAQILVTAKGLSERTGQAEVQNNPPLAARPGDSAAAITPRVALRRPPGVFPAGPDRRAQSLRDPDSRPGKGSPRREGFDPRMLAMLLLYAYCVGVVSSRKIERA